MTFLSVALAAAAVLATGCATVRAGLGAASRSPFDAALRALLAVVFGLGIWSGAYALVRFVGGSSGTLLACDAVLLAVGVIAARKLAAPVAPAPANPTGPIWLGCAFVGAVLLAAAIFATLTADHPEGVDDAWLIWTLRARFLGRDADLHHAFSETAALWHLDYPLFLPGLISQGWRVLGGESGAVPIGIAALFTGLAVAIPTAALGAVRGGASGLATGLVVMGAPVFVFVGAGQIADVPLGVFLAAGCVALARAFERPDDRGPAALAGLALSLAAWTKNEGLIHLIAFAVVFALIPGDKLVKRSRLLAFFLGALPFLVLLAWFKLAYAPRNDLVSGLGVRAVLGRIADKDRYLVIAKLLLLEVYSIHFWNLFPAVLPLLVVTLGRRHRSWSGAGAVGLALATAWAGLLLAYLLSPYDVRWHVSASLDRLVTQSWPSIVLATFLALPPLDGGRGRTREAKVATCTPSSGS